MGARGDGGLKRRYPHTSERASRDDSPLTAGPTVTTFWVESTVGTIGGRVRNLLVPLFYLAVSASLAIETGPPRSRFALGTVDLVALAASLPPIENAEPAQPEPERLPTCRELHARIEAFLAKDVGARVASARSGLTWAERQSAISTGGNVSDGMSALFFVLLGSFSHVTNVGVRDAKACLAICEGYDAKVRALRDDVPETDSPAPPGLLERWERIAAELDEKPLCHRGR